MPFNFDDSEFAEQADTAASAALKSLEQSPEPATDPAEDPELADVDLRLETADYYRAILNHEFFDVESPAAQIVDREVRVFIRERLEILLGLRDAREPEVVSPFSDDEVQALKIIAAKVLGKPSLITPQEPMVKKMATPAPAKAPAPKPLIKPKPQAKKIPAPAPAPSTKPKAKAKAASEAKAEKQPISQTRKVVDRTIENPESQTFIAAGTGKEVTLVEGEVIEEEGRRFIVARNDKGTLFRKDITGQVIPTHRLPPMSPHQLSLASQQQAEQQINSLDQVTGLAVLAALKQN